MPPGKQVDIWALGILTCELLFDYTPFEVMDEENTDAQNYWQTVVNIKNQEDLDLPSDVLSDRCIDFIQLALTKDPQNRPSAAELLEHPW
jgi:serine/threonine protein kinase